MKNIPLVDDQVKNTVRSFSWPIDFIFIGEIHGTDKNAEVVLSFLKFLIKNKKNVALALEWELTKDNEIQIQSYIKGRRGSYTIPNFFGDSDGRFTLNHLKILKWIRNHNAKNKNKVDVIFFGGNESHMKTNLTNYKIKHRSKTILVETGNFHARKYLTKRNRPSVASFLASNFDILSILLMYKKGTVMVEGAVLDITRAASQKISYGKLFDAKITIQNTNASHLPSGLTKLNELLK